MAERHLKATWIAETALAQSQRFLVHQGGTRSGKTWNLSIALACLWEETEGRVFSVVRKSGPALKSSVLRDLLEVLDALGLYDPAHHNRSDQTITNPRSGSVLEYFSADQPQKLRGRKRHLLWMNEGNELTIEDFRQLNLRTTGPVWLDFNPSMQDHWIWDLFGEGDPLRQGSAGPGEYGAQAERFVSTYRDNPFLSAETVRQIEAYRRTDAHAWAVYGLGQRGASPLSVFPTVRDGATWDTSAESVYGLDFGITDPLCLVEIQREDARGLDEDDVAPVLRCRGLIHESYLTTDALIPRMKGLGVTGRVWCDGADPDRIAMLVNAGIDAAPAEKGPGSVLAGIDYLRGHRVEVAPGPASAAVLADLRGYRWKTRADGTRATPEAPAHDHSHAPDALRYGAFTQWGNPTAVQLFL